MEPERTQLAKYFERLWPICRSITGEGFRTSLDILSEIMPTERLPFKTGEKVFDWTVPQEWNVKDAYLIDPNGKKRCSLQKNNLHLLGYSIPFQGKMKLDELKTHLYTLPDQPQAIPYLTSYYKEHWGFCLTHSEFQELPDGEYEVCIDSELKDGRVELGQAVLPGESKAEVLFSSYLCHPSMANNELSGPLLITHLYQRLKNRKLKYTYRFLITAETIGALCYLSKFGEDLKQNLIAGFQITCVGDPGPFTFKPSRRGHTIADRVAQRCLQNRNQPYSFEKFNPADGSDERQYCSPGFDLPIATVTRTMYAKYAEYHTSLDNLDFICMESLQDSINFYEEMVDEIESLKIYKSLNPYGEPQLGKRGLYPNLGSQKEMEERVNALMWALNMSDGTCETKEIAEKSGHSPELIENVLLDLKNHDLMREIGFF